MGFTDALYMTVITLTTVGYREVRVLDASGQLWTQGAAARFSAWNNSCETGRSRKRDKSGSLRGRFANRPTT
jgi:hypothetical protein